jgi:4-amino-4-deoxy-L-arabinose transferase-like glycosyltransferase
MLWTISGRFGRDTAPAGGPMTPPRRDRVTLAAGTGLLLVTALAIFFARAAAFNHDEFFFLEAAKNLALHGKYATVWNGQSILFDPYISTGPTVVAPIAVTFRVWRPGYFVARLVMVAFFVALFLLLYRVALALEGRAVALVACAFVLCVPLVFFMGLHVLGEFPAVVLFLAGVHFLLQAEHSLARTPCYLLAGLFLGLAALTKLIFLLGVAALGALAVLVAVRDRRRAFAICGGVVVGLAVLAGWEFVQLAVVGPGPYRELKQDFYHMFAQEAGVKAWLGAANSIGYAFGSAHVNFMTLNDAGWGVSFVTLLLITVVAVELSRRVKVRRHTAVHVFLGLFLGSYILWFFFATHEPFYRLFIPAYLVAGIYPAAALVEIAAALKRPIGVRRKFALGSVGGVLVVVVFIAPFVGNGVQLVKTYLEQPVLRNVRLIAILQEKVPADARIGYWGWWRAPEVSFFLPNQFIDISVPSQRRGLVPDRDFIFATATQRRLDPQSWEQQRRFCREELIVRGRNTLCRFGFEFAQKPVAPSPRLDFMGRDLVREDQLTDGFYRTIEPPPRWVASTARFLIGTPGKEGRLRLVFDVPTFLRPSAPNPVTVIVTVNDAVRARQQFDTAGPKSVMTDCISVDSDADAARVEVTTNRSFVPHQIGLNADTRVLALQLRQVEFQSGQCGLPR